MSTDDFRVKMADIGKEDQKFFESQFIKAKTDTESEVRSRAKFMVPQLGKALENMKYIKKDEYGHYQGKNLTKWNDAQSELIQEINSLPKGTNLADQERFVQKKAAEINSRNNNNGGFFQSIINYFSGDSNKPATPTPTTNAPVSTPPPNTGLQTPVARAKPLKVEPSVGISMSNEDWVRAYMKENNNTMPDFTQLKKFKESKTK